MAPEVRVRRPLRLLANLSALALVLTACGGAGADTDVATGDGPTAPASPQPEPDEEESGVPTTGSAPTTAPSTVPSTTAEVPSTTTTSAPPPPPPPPPPTPPEPSALPLLPTTTTTAPEPPVDPPPAVPDPGGVPGRNSVLVVGDSVFLGTTAVIPAALSEWVVTYDAVGNRRLAQAIDLLAARRGEIGEAVVVHLGNNYIPGERGDYASQIDEAMTILADVPRVVWVTVAEVSDSRREINRAIRDAAARWPNLRVADWAPIIGADPGLSWDGLHLTPDGRRRMADLIAATLGPVPPAA